jgi:hypothetical protein
MVELGSTAMVKTVILNAEIPPSRELRISVPADVPTGSAEITIRVSRCESGGAATFGQLLNSQFFGIWRERPDAADSVEFARKLRSHGWKRPA